MRVSLPDGGFGVTGSVVTANYFSVLRLQPSIGRFFSEDEDRVPGRNPVAILSHDLWRSRFGGDPQIVGASVRINGTDFTVVGIAPEDFRGIMRAIDAVEIWIPTTMFKVGYRFCDGLTRACRVVNLVGRLAEGMTLEQAQSELTVLARQLETMFPGDEQGTRSGRATGSWHARRRAEPEPANSCPRGRSGRPGAGRFLCQRSRPASRAWSAALEGNRHPACAGSGPRAARASAPRGVSRAGPDRGRSRAHRGGLVD